MSKIIALALLLTLSSCAGMFVCDQDTLDRVEQLNKITNERYEYRRI